MGTPHLPLACFGKLPFWPEYLQVGAALPSSRFLKQWLHQGREELDLESAERETTDTDIRANLRTLLAQPGSSELLAGVIRPSRDQGGRRFPFAVFVHLPRQHYGKHYALNPLGLAPVWEMLDDAWDSLANVTTHEGFDETIRGFEIPRPAPTAQLRGVYRGMQQSTADGLFERRDGASMDCLERNMPELLPRLKAGDGVAVELPVSRDLGEACFDTTFWIDLINRQFMMRRFEPVVFMDETVDLEERTVLFKFGALEPSDYGSVMALRAPAAGRLRPAHPAPGDAASAVAVSTGVTYAALLEKRYR